MKYILSAALALLMLSTITHADDGVLVDHVPSGAKPEITIAIVRQSLTNRGWGIVSYDASSVSASISQPRTHATLRIVLTDSQLTYTGEATTNSGNPAASQLGMRARNIPASWLRRLRIDVSTSLATFPEVTSSP